MQEIITLYRKKAAFTGEVLEHKGKQFVVTHIFNIEKSVDYPDYLAIDAVCQEVGAASDYEEYEPVFTFEERYDLSKVAEPRLFERVGEVYWDEGLCGMITNILDVKYDTGYLIVELESKLIEPWSNEQIQRFVKYNRVGKLSVIEGKSDSNPQE
ncbi:hypothetical protein [Enterococcus sp. AZ109]|uniref:hypothetical protein n=1 Tax=Enterococcus sp. AZ109 TaxID=2774634 RepID=UPI003F218809